MPSHPGGAKMEMLDGAIKCEKCQSNEYVVHIKGKDFVCWFCMKKVTVDKPLSHLYKVAKERGENVTI